MPKKKYLVTLADDERQELEHLLHSGTHATRKVTRARILLKAADGWEDQAIAEALSVGRATVERLRQRFVEEGLGAFADHPRPGMPPKLDEKAEARLIAAACSPRRKGASVGPCTSWLTKWWHSASLRPIPMRASAAC
jgi:transposase